MSAIDSIELLRLAMNMAMSRQQVAGGNLQNASLGEATTSKYDFSALVSELSSSEVGVADRAANLSADWQRIQKEYLQERSLLPSLDLEVANSRVASGEYTRNADLLSRRLQLLHTAMKGGR